MTNYEYPEWTWDELNRVIKTGLIPSGMNLKRASIEEDYGGVDASLVINQTLRVQVRCRFNRWVLAPQTDVTFRFPSEPHMIEAGTYAPVALFAWFRGRYIVAAHVVDVYHMAEHILPPLVGRVPYYNEDGSRFVAVRIAELYETQSWLRHWDGRVWSTPILGGERRWQSLLQDDSA